MAANAQSTPEGLIIGEESKGNDLRQLCKYGTNCYQKNPMHHQKFRHPSPESSDETIGSTLVMNAGQKENTNADSNKMLNTNNKDNTKKTSLSPPPKKPKFSEETKRETQVNAQGIV